MKSWERTSGDQLEQGDLLVDCLIPRFDESYGETKSLSVKLESHRIVVLTQSCDLLKLPPSGLVLSAATWPLPKYEDFTERKLDWESVRKGHFKALFLLKSPYNETDPALCLCVDFRQLATLPLTYLSKVAARADRFRLVSPFREELSQAFGGFYSRVGTPRPIPSFKKK